MDTEKILKDVRPTLEYEAQQNLIQLVSKKYGFLQSNITLSAIVFLLTILEYDAELPLMGSDNFIYESREYVVRFFVPEPFCELKDLYALVSLG